MLFGCRFNSYKSCRIGIFLTVYIFVTSLNGLILMKSQEKLISRTLLIGYWESLLQQLKAHMARTRLRERHQENLKLKLQKLKQEVST